MLIDMCNNMALQHHSVTLCVINKDYETTLLDELNPQVRLILFDRPMGDSKKLPYMRKLAEIIAKDRYDVLHCQGLNCVIFSALAKLRCPHIKILNTVHDVNNFPRYTHMQVFLHNLLCSHVIAISKTVEHEILARGTASGKVSVIYNAIDTKRFSLCDHPHIHNGHIHPIDPNAPIVIGNVARIIPAKKGQMVLLKAVDQLKQTFPNIHCYFAGDVVPNYDEQYHELLNYIKEQQLEKHVAFLGNVTDIPSFLSTLDIFVLPSFYEGFGIALIEALSTGIPCIASALDGPAEILSSPNMGSLFCSGNSNELADKITDMIYNYTTYDPLRISRLIKDHYSISSLVDQHISIYKKCLK